MEEKIRKYRKLKREADLLLDKADKIKEELKAFMEKAGKDKVTVGEYLLTYKEVINERLDKELLENTFGDLRDYMKISRYKQLRVN